MRKVSTSVSKGNCEWKEIMECCVTGDTKLWTVDGVKTFDELARLDDDVNVYCLDSNGDVKISKMFHPRVSGYNVEVMKVTLDNGTILNVTPNHMFLTTEGYVSAEDLYEGDDIIVLKKDISLPVDIDENDKRFTEYTGTKKGTVIKTCEVSGEEFECTWDEREICCKNGYEADLFNMKKEVVTASDNYEYVTVSKVEFTGERKNVYNGSVAIYHNYFTVDENTNTIVNQYV